MRDKTRVHRLKRGRPYRASRTEFEAGVLRVLAWAQCRRRLAPT